MNRLSDHMTGKNKQTNKKPTKTNKSVLQKKIVDRQILNETYWIGLDYRRILSSSMLELCFDGIYIIREKIQPNVYDLCIISVNIHLHFFTCSRAIANYRGTLILVKPLMPF